MAFDGTEGGEITLTSAGAMTAKYRRDNPNQILAHFFGKDIITKILDQEGCIGLRLYHGVDEDGKKELVIVGADSDENDMLEIVVDLSRPCPNVCGDPNPLNS